jgi:hypothetical protein
MLRIVFAFIMLSHGLIKKLWHIAITAYSEFNGMRVASANEVTWRFKSGDFAWLRLELTDLEINKPKGY